MSVDLLIIHFIGWKAQLSEFEPLGASQKLVQSSGEASKTIKCVFRPSPKPEQPQKIGKKQHVKDGRQ